MKKIHEVCKSVGVSKRTLQYYDEIGLLSPTEYTESGYRLYDDTAIEKLWQILLLKELGYPLGEIKYFMDNPNIDLRDSIGHRIDIMVKKKKRLENLIGFARAIKFTGVIPLSFEEYGEVTFEEFIDNTKNSWNMSWAEDPEGIEEDRLFDHGSMLGLQGFIDEYLNEPEKEWNDEEITKMVETISDIPNFDRAIELQECIDGFASLTDMDVASEEVQMRIGKLYEKINSLFDRSMSLNGFLLYSKMFVSGGDAGVMHTNRLGEKTTEFIAKAIQIYHDNISTTQAQMEGE